MLYFWDGGEFNAIDTSGVAGVPPGKVGKNSLRAMLFVVDKCQKLLL